MKMWQFGSSGGLLGDLELEMAQGIVLALKNGKFGSSGGLLDDLGPLAGFWPTSGWKWLLVHCFGDENV